MKPVYLKTIDTRLAGAERKIRFLERRSQIPEGTELGGIQFDTHPQEGDWLEIVTLGGGEDRGILLYNQSETTVLQLMSDRGISVTDITSSGSFGGLNLSSLNRDITLEAGANLVINSLPTTSPGGTDRVWRDSGVLKIT